MKKHLKPLLSLVFLTAILILPYFVFAQSANNTPGQESAALNKLKIVADGGGYQTETSLAGAVGLVIRGALSLLGAIFIILIIIAGYKWMTAGGNEKAVEEAKTYIQRAIIGLIVTLASWAIWAFVLEKIIIGA